MRVYGVKGLGSRGLGVVGVGFDFRMKVQFGRCAKMICPIGGAAVFRTLPFLEFSLKFTYISVAHVSKDATGTNHLSGDPVYAP